MIVSRVVSRGIAAAAIVVCSIPGCSSQPPRDAAAPAPAAQEPAATTPSVHAVGGKAPAAVNGIPSVVVLNPRTPKEFAPPAEKPYMDQITLSFTPPVLFVRTGQPTEFRNSDDVLHNVRVREEATREGLFNVAIITGGTYTHTFARDGFYDVGCDIHPGMSAMIISSSTPYALMADAEGYFHFDDVPPGPYLVTIYSGTEKIERPIDVSGPRTEVGL
jgi:plastocyanin